jgi:hypothetical protein
MQPEVATGETTTFPSSISALTGDAPHMQGPSSRPAPVACAVLNASTATIAAMTTQVLKRRVGRNNLTTTRMPRAANPSAKGPRGSSSTEASPIASGRTHKGSARLGKP